MISFDGSALGFEENVRETREAVEAVKSINADVVVEGELGYVGSGSDGSGTVAAPSVLALSRRIRGCTY